MIIIVVYKDGQFWQRMKFVSIEQVNAYIKFLPIEEYTWEEVVN